MQSAAAALTEPPAELASIITALDHLPQRTETDPEKVAERMREKQIIRERLARLCRNTPEVRAAIFAVSWLESTMTAADPMKQP